VAAAADPADVRQLGEREEIEERADAG